MDNYTQARKVELRIPNSKLIDILTKIHRRIFAIVKSFKIDISGNIKVFTENSHQIV